MLRMCTPPFQSSPGGPVNQFKICVSDLSDRVGEVADPYYL
eukprot:SAG31_NODE_8674_length_1408_cov_4.633308_1_plen_41_part_00